ncbi:LacI family DNA-binding transcriptional regulator [Agathobacter sp.]
MKKKKVNISHIAKELDISPSTVSRALSGSGRISQNTRVKINEYLESHNLIPNTRERHYSDIVTKMISVVLPGEGDFVKIPYFSNVLYSVYDYFSIRGY